MSQKDEADVIKVERQFFNALVEGNVNALDQILADDFMLIDVMAASEITKPMLLEAIGSGPLKFESVKPLDSRVRLYGITAIVTGSTQMSGRFGETPFAAHSRYTHVFVEQEGRWRLASAQGTQILGE